MIQLITVLEIQYKQKYCVFFSQFFLYLKLCVPNNSTQEQNFMRKIIFHSKHCLKFSNILH